MKANNILVIAAMAFVTSAAFVCSCASSLADEPNATASVGIQNSGAAGTEDSMASYFDKISSLNSAISPSNASSAQAEDARDASYGEALSLDMLSSLTHTPGFTTYSNFTDYGIKIDYPENWSVEESEVFGLDAVLFFPPLNRSTQGAGQFRDNISLAYQSLPMALGPEQFAEIFLSEIEERSSNFSIVSEEDTTLGTVPSKEFVISLNQANTDIKMKQVYAVNGARAYIVTCTSEAGRFDDLDKTFRRMLMSADLTR